MIEDFRVIKGFEDYEVSNLGRVRSLKFVNFKILKNNADTKGYLKVHLYNDGKQHVKRIHQLVAIEFLNHIPCGYHLIVDHIDGNRLNNHVSNLQLISQRHNTSRVKKIKSSKYIGVSLNRGKWKSQIFINGKSKYLGHFDCELEASNAYKKALEQLLKKH